MEGLSRATGAAVPVDLDGKKYLVSPITLGDFGVFEQEVLKHRPDPLMTAAKYQGVYSQE